MKKTMAMLCLVCLLLSCLGGCGKKPQEPVVAGTYISVKKAGENLAILYNDTLIVTEYAYHHDIQLTLSRNGDYGLCKTSEGALLYIHDGEMVKLTEQVKNYRMNATGTTVLYQEVGDNSLQWYQKATGKTEVISNGFIVDYALSPDGQTVAYLASASEWEGNYRLFVEKTGAERKELEMGSPQSYALISINDEADLLYLWDKNIVFSMDGEGKTSVVRNKVTERIFYSNADHTQLMFHSDGMGTCLSIQGQVSEKLTEQWLEPLEPTGLHFVTNGTEPDKLPFAYGVLQTTCHFQDLAGQLLGEQVWYLNETGFTFWLPNAEGVYTQIAQTDAYANRQNGYYLDPQGRFLYYSKSGEQSTEMYYVNLETGAEPILVVEKVSYFAVRRDGLGVYNVYGGLYFHSVAEDVEPQRLVDTENVTNCFVSENNRVYICRFVGAQRNLFVLNEEGTEAELVLENIDYALQEDCGMIYILAGEDHYVIRAGELIKLQVKT